jgi:3-dehydroquinate dehydratase
VTIMHGPRVHTLGQRENALILIKTIEDPWL